MWYIISADKTLSRWSNHLMKFLILFGRSATVCIAHPGEGCSKFSTKCKFFCFSYLIFICVRVFEYKIWRFTDFSDYNCISRNIWKVFPVSGSRRCMFYMYRSAWGQAYIVIIFEILSVLQKINGYNNYIFTCICLIFRYKWMPDWFRQWRVFSWMCEHSRHLLLYLSSISLPLWWQQDMHW